MYLQITYENISALITSNLIEYYSTDKMRLLQHSF